MGSNTSIPIAHNYSHKDRYDNEPKKPSNKSHESHESHESHAKPLAYHSETLIDKQFREQKIRENKKVIIEEKNLRKLANNFAIKKKKSEDDLELQKIKDVESYNTYRRISDEIIRNRIARTKQQNPRKPRKSAKKHVRFGYTGYGFRQSNEINQKLF
jgi:hypothetical protein